MQKKTYPLTVTCYHFSYASSLGYTVIYSMQHLVHDSGELSNRGCSGCCSFDCPYSMSSGVSQEFGSCRFDSSLLTHDERPVVYSVWLAHLSLSLPPLLILVFLIPGLSTYDAGIFTCRYDLYSFVTLHHSNHNPYVRVSHNTRSMWVHQEEEANFY